MKKKKKNQMSSCQTMQHHLAKIYTRPTLKHKSKPCCTKPQSKPPEAILEPWTWCHHHLKEKITMFPHDSALPNSQEQGPLTSHLSISPIILWISYFLNYAIEKRWEKKTKGRKNDCLSSLCSHFSKKILSSLKQCLPLLCYIWHQQQ